MVRHEGDPLKRVVVCTPREEYARAGNCKEHNIGDLGRPEIAIQQHDTLKNTLREFGAEVLDLPELSRHPNSVFTRDTAICTPQGYIKLFLGLPTREAEGAWMAQVLDSQGERCIGEITPPGTLEGGDVVLAGDVAFIAKSVRTNDEGIRQFSAIMTPLGYEIRIIALPDSILHLDKVLMTLGGKQVLFCDDFVSPSDLMGFDGIAISCHDNTTANVICLGNQEIIANRSNKVTIDLLRNKGYRVHDLDLGEFAKGMGGPNCLVMPVERG